MDSLLIPIQAETNDRLLTPNQQLSTATAHYTTTDQKTHSVKWVRLWLISAPWDRTAVIITIISMSSEFLMIGLRKTL